jgi:hypothetical protein
MRPPPEFLGQARLLRQRVAATDDLVEPIMERALRPMGAPSTTSKEAAA